MSHSMENLLKKKSTKKKSSKGNGIKKTAPKVDKKTAVVMEDKEKSWYIPPSQGIPIYKAENDPFCPAAKVRKFNDEQKLKMKEALKQQKRSQTWVKEKLENKFEDIPLRLNVGLRTKAMEAGNIYPSSKPALAEVEVLQKILVRERLLSELQRLVKSGSDMIAIMGEVVELVKAIRFETVDIIEDIATWQTQQPTPRPFLFKGVNYLLKISSDFDFLDTYDDIVEKFCFEFKSNPLAYRGGGNLITGHRIAANSDNYLQGLLKSYYSGPHALVDGIEVVRLHNAEKVIQAEFTRIAKLAKIGEGQTLQQSINFEYSSFQELHQPHSSSSPLINAAASTIPPEAFQETIERNKHGNNNKNEKKIFNPTKIKLERIAKLKEEADELSAMLSHVQEKIGMMASNMKDLLNRRKVMELRLAEAKSQGKEVAAQHLVAEILVVNTDLAELNLKIKEAQKESYFLTLEKKRKLGVVKKLKEELELNKQKEILKKKIEEKIKKDGLIAALDAVHEIADKIKAKTPKKKSAKPRRDDNSPEQMHHFDSLQNPVNREILQEEEGEEEEEEDGEEEEEDGGEEEDEGEEDGEEEEEEEEHGYPRQESGQLQLGAPSYQNFPTENIQSAPALGEEEEEEEEEEEGEDDEEGEEEEEDEGEGEEEGEEEEDGEEEDDDNVQGIGGTGLQLNGQQANQISPDTNYANNSANYISEDEESLMSPFNGMNLQGGNINESPNSLAENNSFSESNLMNYHTQEEAENAAINLSHSAGNAYFAVKALREAGSTEL